jgi:hypothetical protein
MTKIVELWDSIQPRVPEGNSSTECVAQSFLYPWNHDNANMDMICNFIKLTQPKIVIETGTFEGFGTEKMAKAMSEVGGGFLITFDAGIAPVNTLGPTYGVPADQILVTNYKELNEGWKCWEKVIIKRDERLKRNYKDVTLTFIEGLTFDTLPDFFNAFTFGWYFCFQDSCHVLDDILKEWKVLKENSHFGSVIVLDDIPAESNVVKWFVENEPDWVCKHTKVGHQQLWMERIR